MKRHGHLWSDVTSFNNLLRAYLKARRGKRSRDEVACFDLNLEKELLQLQLALKEKRYCPGVYRLFAIYERKPRQICAAPFRDRVVHHALMNIVDPLLDRGFIHDSYACRPARGVHKAVDRYQEWSKRHAYALKLDVARYFPSIDHVILKQQLRRRIKDLNVLWLLDLIIDRSPEFASETPVYFPGDDLLAPFERKKGLPIGNLTSQFLANLYLNDLDHYIKEDLKVKCYLRYVDDLILLADCKSQLHEWTDAISDRLLELRLRLHPKKINVFQVNLGVDVLGYRVFPAFRLLRNDNGHRFGRKLRRFARAYRNGRLDWEDFNPSVQSWIGHAVHADTWGLRKTLFNSTVFTREKGNVCRA